MRVEDRRILENELLVQLTDVERELAKLESRRATLRELLLKVRRENLTLRDVTRKNSYDRIMIESRILQELKVTSREVTTKRLYSVAREINPQLRNTTFRSYLHRLKSKGFITNAATHGRWTVPGSSKRPNPEVSAEAKPA